MNHLKSVTYHAVYLLLALGLIIGSVTPSWSADAITTTQATSTVDEVVPLIDNRLLSIGLGALGGVAAYSFLTSSWGMATGMRVARAGLPGTAAFRAATSVWGGRWVFSTASGLIGALVGDWIYRSNQANH